MLTSEDLEQIGKVVKQQTEDIVKEEIKPIKETLIKVEMGQKALRKVVNKLAKDQSVMLRVLNNESVKTKIRVDRIEEHLDLPPLKLPY